MKKIKITKEQHLKLLKLIKENNSIDKQFNRHFNTSNLKTYIKESDDYNIKDETKKFLEILYGVKKIDDEFSIFWAKYGLTYDEICKMLEDKNIIIKNNEGYEVSKSLGTAEEAKEKLKKELDDIIKKAKNKFELLFKNYDFSILKDKNDDLYLLNYGDIDDTIENNYEDALINEDDVNILQKEIEGFDVLNVYPFNFLPDKKENFDFSQREKAPILPNLEGYSVSPMYSKEELKNYISNFIQKFKEQPIFLLSKDSNLIKIKNFEEYQKKQQDLFGKAAKQTMSNNIYENIKLKKDDTDENILLYVNKIANKAGEGLEDLKKGIELVKIDKELKNELLSIYSKDNELTSKLSGINESETEEERQKRIQAALERKRKESKDWEEKFFKDREEKNKELLIKQKDEKTDSPNNQLSLDLKEMGTGGSMGGAIGTNVAANAGSYVTALNTKQIEKEMPIVPKKVPVVKESLTATPNTTGEYTVPAFKMKKNHTDFAEVNPKAFQKTQWADGSFVEFDDCTKLNNNKKAQKGGCSAGAVDNVVKLKKGKGSVNAPSLTENKIYETIAKQTGKTIEEVKRIIETKKNK